MAWHEHIRNGISAAQQSDMAGAEKSLKLALHEAKEKFGRTDSRLALTLSLLGHTYFHCLDFPRAERLLEQSVRLHSQSPDFNDACFLMDSFSLGTIKIAHGQRLEACRLYGEVLARLTRDGDCKQEVVQRAVEQFQSLLNEHVPQLNDDERRILMGKPDEEEHAPSAAEPDTEYDTTSEPAPLPPPTLAPADAPLPGIVSAAAQATNDPSISGSYSAADIWEHQLNKGLSGLKVEEDEKETLVAAYLNLESALRLARKLFQPGEPQLISTINALAESAAKLRMQEVSEALFREAIMMARQHARPDQVDVSTLRIGLALLYADFERFKQVRKIFEEENVSAGDLVARFGETLAPRIEVVREQIKTFEAVQSLLRQAQTAEEAGDLERAAKFTNTALSQLRQAFPPQHPEQARVLRYRARLLEALGNTEQCSELSRRAERIEKANEALNEGWTKLTDDLPRPENEGVTV